MDFFDIEFPDLPSIAPDLMFEEEPLPPTDPFSCGLTPDHRDALLHFVLDDHAYAKPYPIRSSTNNKSVTPLRILKLHQADETVSSKSKRNESRYQSHGSEDDDDDDDVDVDVVSVDDNSDKDVLKYDKTKAHYVMNEVEVYLNSLWKDVDKDDDEKITRATWSKEQAGFFDVIYKLITNYQLAKLSYYKNSNEPVLRKLALDKATKRIRQAFGSIFWNTKLIVWLHSVMIDGLGSSLFLCYLEILQSLKRKTPALFERIMLCDKSASDKELSLPNLGQRLKKSWDPSTGIQSNVTMDKFPATPFLIIVPSGPSIPHQSTKRNRFWNNQLSNFSKVFPINVPAYKTFEGYVIKHYLEHCISAIRTKIRELRDRFPERHVILVGWEVGSLISLKVANLDKVDAIVCLGFPTNGIDGDVNEDCWKGLTKIECPVLFFLGTHAATSSVTDTEKLRRRMKTQTDLILIESADELLLLTSSQMKSLGMTQNMVDKLVLDEVYLFLKSVLFKPKPVITPPPKGPAIGKKRKKKVDAVEKGEAKKKKKSNVKSVSLLPDNVNDSPLLPLDVSISSLSSIPLGTSQGLLTTGSVYTPIPVTQLQSESLTDAACNVLLPSSSTSDVIVSTAKEIVKRSNVKEAKEKVKRNKGTKKSSVMKNSGMSPASLEFVADMGNEQTSITLGDQFSSGEIQSSKSNVTFQRIPTGSFVLSSASGQVRLQGAANIVYLPQATSSNTKLLSPTNISTTCSGFTAVISSSHGAPIPPKINIVPSSNFKFGPVNANHNPNKGLSAVISSTGCGSLVFAATTMLSPISDASPSVDSKATNIADVQVVYTQPSSSTNQMETLSLESPPMVSTTSLVTSTTSTIMTHLSANDIRYLASLIAKHSSSRPNSPITSSIGSAVLSSKTDIKSLAKTSRDNNDDSVPTCTLEVGDKSSLTPIFDKKIAVTPVNQSAKKGSPSQLVHRVSSIQQKDNVVKMKTPRMKTAKLSTSLPVGHIITTKTTKGSSIPTNSKALHKVPATLTIPISHLQSNINSSSSLSYAKSVNVPLLSSCLSQDKIVISSTKSSESLHGSRTIVGNPNTAKKSSHLSGLEPLGGNAGKMNNTILLPGSSAPTQSSGRTTVGGIFLTKTPFSSGIKSPNKGNRHSPITLHLPSPVNLRDPKVLRKAVSDVKVVGVLSQQSKSHLTPLVNLSALRSISNPSSPVRNPTGDPPDDINPEELSDKPPRQLRDELKSEDRKKSTMSSPLKKSTLMGISDNVKPLTPPTIPSSTLLAASIPRDITAISRSNTSGKVGTTAFLGKLFGGPKSIVDPTWGKLSFTKQHNEDSKLEPGVVKDGDDKRREVSDYHDGDNDSDVDFAISPASPVDDTALGSVLINRPVIFDPVKRSNITKIVYAPLSPSNDKINFSSSNNSVSKNIIDIARAKLRETQFKSPVERSISPNVGMGMSKGSLEFRSALEENIGSDVTSDSKLRFEPVTITNTRAKVTSVLSRREGKPDSGSTVSMLHSSCITTTNSIVPKSSVLYSVVCRPKETEVKHSVITNHSIKPSTVVPSLSLKPLSNVIVCDSESSQGLHPATSEEVACDSVIGTTAERTVIRNSATANGVTAKDMKEVPSPNSNGDVVSLVARNETVHTDSKILSLDNLDLKGGPAQSKDTTGFKGTAIENADNKGAYLTNIETKLTHLSAALTKGSTIVTNADTKETSDFAEGKGIQLDDINKGELFHSIEDKWPFLNTEGNEKTYTNSKSRDSYYIESEQISKFYTKSSKPPKEMSAYQIMIEEDPQPYITRSGRVKRSKYSIQYIDELDGKKTSKKKRPSTSKDDPLLAKKSKTVETSQTSPVTLENLVEAAELIKNDGDSLVNGGDTSTEGDDDHQKELPTADSTTDIAATAMLKLLSGDKEDIEDVENMPLSVIKNVLKNDEALIDKVLCSESSSELGASNCADDLKDRNSGNMDVQDKKVNDIAGGKTKKGVNNLMRTSHKESVNVSSEGSDSSVGVTTLNPTIPSLPTLVPIQKTITEVPCESGINSKQVTMEENGSINIIKKLSGGNTCPDAPSIPPLAAIQDKCNDKIVCLAGEVMNTTTQGGHTEVYDAGSCSPMGDDVPIQTENVIISNDGTTLMNMPSLADIQEKTNVQVTLTPCSDILLKHYKISPSVLPPSYTITPVSEILDGEMIDINKSECRSDEDEFTPNVIVTGLNVDESNTELTLMEKANDTPPKLSPPALAIIQSNVQNNLGSDKSDVNSLPPLAAINMNSRESEVFGISNNIAGMSGSKSLQLRVDSNVPENMEHISSSALQIISASDGSETNNETILIDKTNISDAKLTDNEII